MSRTIDERIVEMEFQNAQFERGVQTSIKSLDALKKGLDLEGAEKGLDNLSRSANRFSMSGLTGAIEAVSGKFTAMEVVAITALQRITNQAMDAGERLIKSLSVDQITAGFSKYTDKTKSVNTIINATGKGIDYVNERLDKLIWFTDETSYNFNDMVSNIGKFTSAGVDLDKATTAMMGIATEAALSGQGINEASRAMYNFAQAIGVGQVKLMDWRSIENANMATKEFKETIIETAKSLGTLDKATSKTKKGTTVTFQNFTETLQEGWFTSEVLIESLKKYGEYAEEVYKVSSEEGITAAQAMEKLGDAGMKLGAKAFKAAQVARTFTDAIEATKDAVSSGWMQSFELIFGDVNESAQLWTDVTNALWEVFAAGAERRNEVLKAWHDASEGGRADLLKGVYDAFEALWNIVTAVSDAISKVFPVDWDQTLKNASKGIKEYGKNLKKTFGINEKVIQQETEIEKIVPDFYEQFDGALKRGSRGEGVKAMQERLSELGYDLGTAGIDGIFGPKTEEALKEFQKAAGETIDGIYTEAVHTDIMGALYGTHGETQKVIEDVIVSDELPPALEKISTIAEGFGSIAKIAGQAVHFLAESFGYLFKIVSPVTSALGDFAVTIARCFTSLSDSIDENDTFGKLFKDFQTNLEPVKLWFEEFGAKLREFLGLDKDISTFDELFEHFQEQFNKFLANHPQIAKAWEVIQNVFKQIEEVLTSAKQTFNDFFKVDQTTDQNGLITFLSSAFDKLVDAAGKVNWPALLIAVLAIKKIVNIVKEIGSLAKFGANILAIPGKIGEILEGFGGALERFKKDTIGTTILKIAVSLALVAGSINALSKIPAGDAWRAVGVLTVMSTVMLGVAAAMSKFVNIKMSQSFGLLGIAAGILLMATAMKSLSSMNLNQLATGFLGILALLSAVAIYQKMLSNIDSSGKSSLSLVGIGLGLLLLVQPMKQLAAMNLKQMATGILGILALLSVVAIYQKMLSNIDSGGKSSLGLVTIALGLLLLVQPLKQLAVMNLNQMAIGFLGILSLLSVVAIYQKMLSNIDSSGKSSFNLVIIAAGLIMLMQPLKQLAAMNLDQIATGFLGVLALLSAVAIYQKMMENVKGSAKSSLSLIGMAVGLMLLVKAFDPLAKYNTKRIGKGLLGLVGILTSVALFAKILGKSGGMSVSKSLGFVTFSLAMMLMVKAFDPLTKYNMTEIGKGLAALTGLLLSTLGFAKLAESVHINISSLLTLVAAAGAMYLFALALNQVKDLDTSAMLAFAGSFALVIGSFTAAVVAANTIGGGVAGMAGGATAIGAAFAILAGIVTAVVGGLGLIDEATNGDLIKELERGGQVLSALANALMPFDSNLDNALMYAGAIVAVAGAGVLGVPTIVGGATAIGLAFTILTGITTATLTGIGALSKLSEKTGGTTLKEYIEEGGSVLREVGAALAQFGSGFQSVATKDLNDYATAMNAARTAIRGLADQVGAGDGEEGEEDGPLIKDLKAAFAVSDRIAAYFKTLTPYESFPFGEYISPYKSAADQLATDLGTFGISLGEARKAITGLSDKALTDEDVEFAISCATSLHTFFSGLEPYKVYTLTLFGTYFTAPEQLSTDMQNFATAIETFASKVGGLTVDYQTLDADTAEAIGIAGKVKQFFDDINKESDKLNGLTMAEYYANVTGLFQGMEDMAGAIETLKTKIADLHKTDLSADTAEAIKIAGQVVNFVVDLKKVVIPANRTWVDKLFGAVPNEVETIFEDVANLGTVMHDAAGKLTGLAESGFESNFNSAMLAIGSMARFLNRVGTYKNIQADPSWLSELFIGKTETQTVFQKVGELGAIMNDIVDELAGLGKGSFTTDFKAAMGAIDQMAVFLNKIGTWKVEGTFGTGSDFNEALFPISALGSMLTQFQADAAGVDLEGFSSTVETITAGLDSVATAFTNFATVSGPSSVDTIFADFVTSFNDIGSEMTENIADGMDEGDVTTAMTTVLGAALDVAETKAKRFTNVGSMCARGLAQGINSGADWVRNAAASVMQRAINAAKKVADQASPSKVFAEIGMYNDLGLAQGMIEYGRVVEAASAQTMQGAIDTAGSMFSNLTDLITEDMDTTPVIRPVLDLSAVASGASAMGSYFRSPSVEVSTSQRLAGSILSSSSGSLRVSGNSVSDAASIVNTLHSEFRDMTDAISSMKFVTETGAVIGAIGPGMDRYLGERARTQQRR